MKINLRISIPIGGGAMALLLFFNTQSFSQALWQANGSGIAYTNRSVGIGTTTPTQKLDVAGRMHTSGNAYFDSLAQALSLKAGNISISSNLITSSTGAISFGNNNLNTTGNITANEITANGHVSLNALADYSTDLSSSYTNRSLVDKGWVTSLGYLTGNQPITLSGDVSGSGTTSIASTVAWANGYPAFDARYLRLSGGNLTGTLTLNADPSNALEAATKHYVDTKTAAVNASQWNTSGSAIYYNTGNVGIGTTNPIGLFHIRRNSSSGVQQGASGYPVIITENNHVPSSVWWDVSFSVFEADAGGGRVRGELIADGNGFFNQGTPAVIIRSTSPGLNAPITFRFGNAGMGNSDSEKMRITSTGNVGIGTTTPSQLLEVAGTVYSNTGGFKFPDGSLQTSAANTTNTVDSLRIMKKLKVGAGTLILENDPAGLPNSIYTDAAAPSDLLIQSNSLYPNNTIINNNTGKVGIGAAPNTLSNTAGNYKVDINGDMRVITGGGAGGGNIVFKTDHSIDPNEPVEAKVGIGTENPVRALHVYTEHHDYNGCEGLCGSHNGMRLEDLSVSTTLGTKRTIWDIMPYAGMLLFGKGDINNPYARDEKMAIMDNGNVVIGGSMTSSAKLEVFGSISILNQAHDKNVSLLFGKEDGGSQYAKWGIQYVAPNALASGSMGGLNFWIPSGSQFGDNYLFLADNGNVGLGTANPSAKLDVAGDITTGKVSIGVPGDKLVGNYRLYVADGIITGRCRVADISTADWSDYVFAKDYALLPIYELERFVKKNKHLPDVPSASEVSKTGIDVAQMDALLLKKIEELTLYTIELQKQIDELKKK